ncbi:MAG: HAD family phosphatase [Clostridia bacterium]|nr:HAD family phosphatase [Clostridia bacterium]
MKNIEAVVFDMDGLMFDSERLWMNCFIKACQQQGQAVSEEFLISIAGLRSDLYDAELEKKFGKNFDLKSKRETAEKMMKDAENRGELPVKKGAKELLKFLKEKQVTLAIASSSTIDDIKHRLKVCGIDESYFSSIIGGDMVTKAKPHPQVYLKSCQVLGVKPENAMALEDSDVGIEAASKAGMIAIHIPDLKPSTEKTKAFAFKTLESLLDVIDLFN